jgi:hypothetical protein
MVARINHEHAEREKLEQARQELLKRKQALIAENKKRKDDLANLDQDLEKFIDVRALSFPCFRIDLNGPLLIKFPHLRLPNQFRRSSKRNTEEDVISWDISKSKGSKSTPFDEYIGLALHWTQ